MPIYRDKESGCFMFEFDRRIEGRRIRHRRLLPKAWNRAKAEKFDHEETGRLYAAATGVQRAQHTIDEAVAKYVLHRLPQLKSGRGIEQDLALMVSEFKGKPITALADVCRTYASKHALVLAPATIKNRIRYLTSACRYAWKHHGFCEHDPGERVIVPTVRNERQFFIDRAQMLSIAKKLKHHRPTRAAVRIAFYSGMRLGEILRARRADGVFVLDDTKNGLPRHVPMHPKIVGAARLALPSPSTIQRYFLLARNDVGMEWLHFHDLRHSAASQMINQGIDLYTVGAVLGHRSSISTQRYAHLATDSLRDAISTIGRKLPQQVKKNAA